MHNSSLLYQAEGGRTVHEVEMVIYEIHSRTRVDKLQIHLPPDFVTKVLLEYSYTHLFIYIYGWFYVTMMDGS